ncbi:TPA: hypothetical protein ACTXW4_003605, partial [Legionella anisa]
FVRENNLAQGEPQAAAHDTYLDIYLDRYPELKELFTSDKNYLFIKILDLLGHSPGKLQAPGPFASLKSVADTAIFVQEYSETVTIKEVEIQVATRRAINSLLINRAKDLGVDTHNIETINPSKSYQHLSNEQQNKLAFLMWAGGLRILEDGPDFKIFSAAWNNPKNQTIVAKMVSLLMSNLEQSEGYCVLYNPAGLLHKTDAATGVKAFVGPVDKGGMGASMKEVVEVAFPFILESCANDAVRQDGVVGHNEFQIQQLLEMVQNLLPHLAGLTKEQNKYPNVNFGTIDMNKKLEQRLTAKRTIQLALSSPDRMFADKMFVLVGNNKPLKTTYPGALSHFVTEDKQTGPRAAKAFREMYQIGLNGEEKYSPENCREMAMQYLSYVRHKHLHTNLKEVKSFVNEMTKVIDEKSALSLR